MVDYFRLMAYLNAPNPGTSLTIRLFVKGAE